MTSLVDSWSRAPSRADAIADLVKLAESAGASSGSAGRTWSREDLHGRPVRTLIARPQGAQSQVRAPGAVHAPSPSASTNTGLVIARGTVAGS